MMGGQELASQYASIEHIEQNDPTLSVMILLCVDQRTTRTPYR